MPCEAVIGLMQVAMGGLVTALVASGSIIVYLYRDNVALYKGQTEIMRSLADEANSRVHEALENCGKT